MNVSYGFHHSGLVPQSYTSNSDTIFFFFSFTCLVILGHNSSHIFMFLIMLGYYLSNNAYCKKVLNTCVIRKLLNSKPE